MQNEILKKAKQWATNSYFDQQDRDEIEQLIQENNESELFERFYKDLDFGTGGLRSILGVGSNRMNKYNTRRATQAMANTVLSKNIENPTACVSYDSRNFSEEFSKEVASVFAANGIKTYVFETLTPVPFLSFSVKYKKASAGVFITASHNPPMYNGFKAFWSNAAQVTPPEDGQIIESYNGLTNWEDIKHIDFEQGIKEGLIEWMDAETIEAYYQTVESRIKNPSMCKNEGSKLNIVFTPIHGTGKVPCEAIAARLGFTNFNTVPEQAEPNGDFPTVTSPNPEDPEALALAIAQMRVTNADIVMGTDPDTDRLGVAYIENDEVVFLNGNQIAVLMLHYVLMNLKEKNQITDKSLVLKSIVTSPMQDILCEHYGSKIISTLTGFKWMGAIMNEMDNRGEEFDFVFASEESFGYMGHAQVRDKDGVCAVAQMMEVALYYKLKGMSLTQALDALYTEFGFFHESLLALNYTGKDGADKIERIMKYFRESRPESICGKKITEVEDYLPLTITNTESGNVKNIELVKSNVLGFTFDSGDKLYLRPSGTEPKIKFYTMVRQTSGSLTDKKQKAMSTINEVEKYLNDKASEL
jgi:phosphoglucomutase